MEKIIESISLIILLTTLCVEIFLTKRERFEDRFFELIKLHRENVSEITLGGITGKKVFITLLREYRESLRIVKELFKENNINIDRKDAINIAYLVFFFGTGPNSSRILRDALSEYYNEVVNIILNKFDNYKFKNEYIVKNTDDEKDNNKFRYIPFEGHQSYLGHYYRHLYQSFMYINTRIMRKSKKYEYAKILRAQLSDQELALLIFDIYSGLGKKWRDENNNLIKKYQIIKNLPKNYIDEKEELNLKEEFSEIKFGYEEKN